ncbi:hypothetical protein SOPP22_10565 [Shewanella sp. OPT22]|nr:hypothetical protein SOPP22_10565 [Shewanella sp. OPT22]
MEGVKESIHQLGTQAPLPSESNEKAATATERVYEHCESGLESIVVDFFKHVNLKEDASNFKEQLVDSTHKSEDVLQWTVKLTPMSYDASRYGIQMEVNYDQKTSTVTLNANGSTLGLTREFGKSSVEVLMKLA